MTEGLALLALASFRGVGYWTLYNMAREGTRFGDVLAVADREQAASLLKKFGARLDIARESVGWGSTREQALERANRVAAELENAGVRLLLASDPEFPQALTDLPDPPAWLFVRGNAEVLNRPAITVVGTREPSDDGLWLANSVGASFGHFGAPTVSGLANGIDQIVHHWSLRMHVPTIAVLGTGIFNEYPKGSSTLSDKIVDEGGAIITEYLPRDSYSGASFVRRNRLQAALGRVLVPVEWAAKSGTAHTVRYAAALKRPIAGLRLPDWQSERVVMNNGAAALSNVFTLPGEEVEFRTFIRRALDGVAAAQAAQQLTLF